MGREIRMVPPNHQHPTSPCHHWPKCGPYPGIEPGTHFEPKHNEEYHAAVKKWYDGIASFKPTSYAQYYHEYNGNPPKEERYLSFDPESPECTWFQLYETVSEGSPVSPPFETKEELADYLAENGDFWDQRRRKENVTIMDCRPWGKEAAYKFVFGSGWSPSMVMIDGKLKRGTDM